MPITKPYTVGQEPSLPPTDRSLQRMEQRKEAYPPIEDYLDAQVKKTSTDAAIVAIGVAQEKKYLSDCLAVKDKFK